MKTNFWLVSLLLIMMITAACGPAVESGEPSTTPDASENGGALEMATQAAPAETAVPAATTEPAPQSDTPEAYPPRPTAVPPTESESYPAPDAPVATVDPYPDAVDGFIWMVLPVGVQCEDDVSPYTDLQDAVAGLTAVAIQTGQAEMTELMVCTACGCPTSAHYRVQISVENVGAAQSLGWKREP